MTMTTDLVKPTRPVTRFKVGAWCWIAIGAGHTLGDIFLRVFPRPEDQAFDDLARAHPFDMMGMHRTYYDVTLGFSLAMGVCMVFVGILLLWIARLTAHQSIRPVAMVGLAMSTFGLVLSALLEPPPPIVLFSVATIAFGLSLRNADSDPPCGTTR
jgi:hypothetical protein